MFGEKAVRVRATPISSEMEAKRFLKTSNRMGLTFISVLGVSMSFRKESGPRGPGFGFTP
jgi:hypothetical protein